MLRPALSLLALTFGAGMAQGCGSESDDRDQCKVPADCKGGSPTVTCNAGFCEDPTWGCIGEPDERATVGGPATLRVRLVEIGSSRPLPGSVVARACEVPTSNDPACAPIAGTTASYNAEDGYVTVTGLPANRPFRLLMEPGSGASFYPMDFYAQRPPRGNTEELPVLMTLSYEMGQALASAYDPPIVVRPDATQVMANFLNCAGGIASGVAMEIAQGESFQETNILYMSSDGLPDRMLTATSKLGIGIGVNTPTGSAFTLKAHVGTAALPPFTVRGFPGHLTVVNVYPRAY